MSLTSPDAMTQLTKATSLLTQQGGSILSGQVTQGYDNSKIQNDIGSTNDKLMITKRMKDGYYPERGDIIFSENTEGVVGWGASDTQESLIEIINYPSHSGKVGKSQYLTLSDSHSAIIEYILYLNVETIKVNILEKNIIVKTGTFTRSNGAAQACFNIFHYKDEIIIHIGSPDWVGTIDWIITVKELLSSIPMTINYKSFGIDISLADYHVSGDICAITASSSSKQLYIITRDSISSDWTVNLLTSFFYYNPTVIATFINDNSENFKISVVVNDSMSNLKKHILAYDKSLNSFTISSVNVAIANAYYSLISCEKNNNYMYIRYEVYSSQYVIIFDAETNVYADNINVTGSQIDTFFEDTITFFDFSSSVVSLFCIYNFTTKTLTDWTNYKRLMPNTWNYIEAAQNYNGFLIFAEVGSSIFVYSFLNFPNTTTRLGPCLDYNPDTKEATILIEGIDDTHTGLLTDAEYYVDNFGKLTLTPTPQLYGKALRNNRIAWKNQLLLDALAEKANSVHGHAIGDVSGLGNAASRDVDTSPMNGSTNLIDSNAVFDGLAGKEPVFTKNSAFNKNFGTTAGTVCQGNDSRLSDARTPTSHTHDERYYTETESNARYLGISSKATDSSNLNGVAESESVTAYTIAKRDYRGDLYSRLFRSTYLDESSISGSIAYRVNTSDNYIRFCNSPTAIKTYLGLGDVNIKVFSGTAPTVEGNQVAITHGLDGDKIIAITGKSSWLTDWGVHQEYGFDPGYQFSIYHNTTQVIFILHRTNSDNIASGSARTFHIVVLYKS